MICPAARCVGAFSPTASVGGFIGPVRAQSPRSLEIDLSRVLELDGGDLLAEAAKRDHWLRVFAVMFGREAFLRDGVDQHSFHDRARAEAAFYEERVAASLSKLVFESGSSQPRHGHRQRCAGCVIDRRS